MTLDGVCRRNPSCKDGLVAPKGAPTHLRLIRRIPISAAYCYILESLKMPKYDYFCEANGQTIEASHPMSERLSTWGELCARSGKDLGATPADALVKKLITGGGVVKASALKNPAVPPCQMGAPCCGANSCGI